MCSCSCMFPKCFAAHHMLIDEVLGSWFIHKDCQITDLSLQGEPHCFPLSPSVIDFRNPLWLHTCSAALCCRGTGSPEMTHSSCVIYTVMASYIDFHFLMTHLNETAPSIIRNVLFIHASPLQPPSLRLLHFLFWFLSFILFESTCCRLAWSHILWTVGFISPQPL